MISIQKNFLFIHVPKTGGNSIQNILREYSEDEVVTTAGYQDGVERFEIRNARYDITKHSPLTHYKSVLPSKIYRGLYKFATIRNPWDLMISQYFSPHRGVSQWDRHDFIELLDSLPTLRDYVCLKKHFGNKALDADVDCLIRFEQLDDDFQMVCRKLGITAPPLPQRNRSRRAHYSEYYDSELKELVRKKFREEIDFGGYRFETE